MGQTSEGNARHAKFSALSGRPFLWTSRGHATWLEYACWLQNLTEWLKEKISIIAG